MEQHQQGFIEGLEWALGFIDHPAPHIRETAISMIKAKIKEVEQDIIDNRNE